MFNKVNSIYAFFSFGAAALSFYKLGYLASNLTSESFGTYSLIMLSFVYVIYAGSIGGNEYMLKIGATLSDADQGYLFLTRNNALFYGLVGVLVASLLVIFASLLLFKDGIPSIVYAILILAIITYSYNIFESYYRSQQKILVSSGMLFSKAILVLCSIYIFIDKYGVLGAVLSEVIALIIINLFVLLIEYKPIVSCGIGTFRVSINDMFSNGFYVCMSNLFRSIALSADRYVVLFIFGLHQLGIYSFVMIIYQGAVLLSGIIMNVIGPKVIRDFAREKSKVLLMNLLCKLSTSAFILALLVYPVFYFIVPLFIKMNFIQYDTSEVYFSLSAVYWASVISFIIFLFDWFFICLSKERLISFLSVFSLFIVGCSMAFFSVFDFSFIYYMSFYLCSKLLVLFIMLYFAFKLKGNDSHVYKHSR